MLSDVNFSEWVFGLLLDVLKVEGNLYIGLVKQMAPVFSPVSSQTQKQPVDFSSLSVWLCQATEAVVSSFGVGGDLTSFYTEDTIVKFFFILYYNLIYYICLRMFIKRIEQQKILEPIVFLGRFSEMCL